MTNCMFCSGQLICTNPVYSCAPCKASFYPSGFYNFHIEVDGNTYNVFVAKNGIIRINHRDNQYSLIASFDEPIGITPQNAQEMIRNFIFYS